LKSRHVQAIAGIGMTLGGTVLMPALLLAQGTYNRVPDPNATRVMVSVFKSAEKGLGVQAADAVRSRMNSEFPYKQVYVLPKQDMVATLEASGFPTTDALEPHDQKALAVIMRADEYVSGTVTKTPTGVKVEAQLVLARDNSLIQPLGTFEGKNAGDASSAISKELKEARKQLDGEKKCMNAARAQKYDEAIAFAKEAVTAYPKATLARTCWVNVLITQKAPAQAQLDAARELVALDPKSKTGLEVLAQSYSDLKQSDSAVVALTRLLATDPKNPRLQLRVVEALTILANPAVAKPVVDQAVQDNPGDPDLLKLRWIILLATKEYKEAFTQGDELVKLDTSLADTTYFIRTARAYQADSQMAKAAETAAKGLQKFPNQPSLVFEQIFSLQKAGQLQQALDALDKAQTAKVAVADGNALRIQLLQGLGKTDEVLPFLKKAIAEGDTTNNMRVLALQSAQAVLKKANETKAIPDYDLAVETLKWADGIAPRELKAQAQFILGTAYLYSGQARLTAGDAAKDCKLLKEAKDAFVEAQIMLPKGGTFAPDAMRTAMGAVMQLDQAANQRFASFNCK